MLKFLSKKIVFQWIILIGLLGVSVYMVATTSQFAPAAGAPFLFKSFVNFFSNYEYFGKGIIITVLLFQILFLQYYFRINEYVAKNSLLPACFYLSILLVTNSLTTISPFFFTLFFFLIIISFDFTENSAKLKNRVFWAGIIIALATCFDISGAVLLVLVGVTLFINQFSSVKEVAILLFGFVLFYFYLFSFHFLTNNLDEWILTFQQIKIMGILNGGIKDLSSTLFSLISLSILYLFFIIKFKLLNEAKLLIQRNRIFTLNTRAVLMIICIFLSNSTYPDILGYLFVHLSIYLAILAQEKSPLFVMNELITIITLVALCL
jgi:hypothetical protein